MQNIISNIRKSAVVAVLSLTFHGVLAGDAYSQALQPNLSGGVKVGVSTSTLTGDEVDDAGWRAGFSGGLFATYRITPQIGIQPEALFTVKGSDPDGDVPGVGSGTSGSYEFGYLEIPVLLKVSPLPYGSLRPTLFAGPVLGVKLYGELDDLDLDSQLRSTDWGVTGGAGVEFAGLGRRTLSLDGRLTWGLTDIFDVPGDPQARNTAVMVTLGIGL